MFLNIKLPRVPRHFDFIQRDVIDAAVFSFAARTGTVKDGCDLLAQDEGENSEDHNGGAGCYPHVE